jgi:hypothetical protein
MGALRGAEPLWCVERGQEQNAAPFTRAVFSGSAVAHRRDKITRHRAVLSLGVMPRVVAAMPRPFYCISIKTLPAIIVIIAGFTGYGVVDEVRAKKV